MTGKYSVIPFRGMSIVTFILILALMITAGGCSQQSTPSTAANPQPSAVNPPSPASSAATKQSQPALTPVTVVLDYLPNTNHTGLYVARSRGYYKDAGLDVSIIQPSEGATATLIAVGKGDFGVSYQEDVTYALAAEDPLPIKAIAALIQHNTSGFASYTPKGIVSIKDFEGKVYAGWDSPAEEAVIRACMERAGADFGKLRMVSSSGGGFPALKSTVDICWIYYAWTGVQAEHEDFPLTYLPLKDLHPALDYYTPVLIASDSLLEGKPELVKAFLKATEKGYQDCVSDPKGAAAILAVEIPEYDPVFLEKSQEWLSPYYKDDAVRWGEMRKQVWDDYTAFMVDSGLIDKAVDSLTAFSNEYLP